MLTDSVPITHICDFHTWIRRSPRNMYSEIVSKRMKEILDKHKLYPNKFYEAKVKYEDQMHPYFVWQYFANGFNLFTDFEHSSFCGYERNRKKIKNTDVISATDEDSLYELKKDKKWILWGYDRAVMKPVFKEYDCVYLIGELVISERLKDALESVQPALTGFEIKPYPVLFEYLG